MKEISPELAKDDIQKVLTQFQTIGPGSELDRGAQLVIQALHVARNRIDKPIFLEMLYIRNAGAEKLLPGVVLSIVRDLVDGKINSDQAKAIIDDVLPKYAKAFEELGVDPQIPKILLYLKQPESD